MPRLFVYATPDPRRCEELATELRSNFAQMRRSKRDSGMLRFARTEREPYASRNDKCAQDLISKSSFTIRVDRMFTASDDAAFTNAQHRPLKTPDIA
ncbi:MULTISPECIES: hypothetical protein [unclassified Bradyrhizobium]